MSCDTCNKVEEVSPLAEMAYRGVPNVQTIYGKDGKIVPLNSCLIARSRKPRGGWSVEIRVNNQSVSVGGTSGKDVFNKVKELFSLNSIEMSDSDIWLNLNIQWLTRAIDKFQMVTLAMLMSVAVDSAPVENTGFSLSPKAWINRVFGILEVYLSQSVYEYRQFNMLFQSVRAISNPTDSNVAGRNDLYIILTMEANNLELTPIYNQNEARQWLVDIRNKIGKQLGLPSTTLEQVAQYNHWK